MRNLFLILSCLLFVLRASPQAWQHVYENPLLHNGKTDCRGIRIIDDTIYVSSQFVGNDTAVYAQAHLAKYSIIDGSMLQLRAVTDSGFRTSTWHESYYGYNQLFDSGNDTIYMVCSYFNNGIFPATTASLFKFNRNLDVLFQSPLPVMAGDYYMIVNGCRRDSLGNIFVYGSRQHSETYQMQGANNFLFKLSSNGDLIWAKAYNGVGYGNSACLLSDGDVLLSAIYSGDGYPPQTLIKANSAGTEKWRIQSGNYGFMGDVVCLEKPNGEIITFSISDENQPPNPPSTYYWLRVQTLLDLGSTYNVLDTKYLASTRGPQYTVRGADYLGDSDYLAWGTFVTRAGSDTLPNSTDPNLPYARGFLLRLDENLDSLWMRTYVYPDDDPGQWISEFEIADVASLPDGGFVTCGTAKRHSIGGITQMWLMRLDEYGCLEPGCQNVSVSEIAMGFENTMSVFPNPVSDRCTVVFNSDHIKTIERQHPQTELIVTDLNGQQLHRQTLSAVQNGQRVDLDFSAYASGSYQVHWISGNMWLDTLMVVKK